MSITKCIHCGKYHGISLEAIAVECAAVKKVSQAGYAYDGARTVSHPHLTAVEYLSLDEQRELLEMNRSDKEPVE